MTANPGAISSSSTPINLTNYLNDTVVATINPTALGAYTVTSAVTHDSIDDRPFNEAILPISFNITNFMYARDNNVPFGTVTNPDDLGNNILAYEVGNLFDIWADVACWGINARLTTGTPAGTPFTVKLYSVDPSTGDFVYETESAEYISTNAMINNDRPYIFPSAHQLFANTTYLPVVVSNGNLVLSRGGISDPQTSWFRDEDGTWFFTTNTPWVRLNLDPSLGIEENAGSIASSQVFPNPTTGNTTLAFTLTNTQEVSITVFDMAGKEMTNMALGAKTSGEHTVDINSNNFQSGVYFVNIVSNDGVVTKKLIKK